MRQYYRCYFLDGRGRIQDVAEIKAVADEHAITAARATMSEAAYPAFELWQQDRVVIREAKKASSQVASG